MNVPFPQLANEYTPAERVTLRVLQSFAKANNGPSFSWGTRGIRRYAGKQGYELAQETVQKAMRKFERNGVLRRDTIRELVGSRWRSISKCSLTTSNPVVFSLLCNSTKYNVVRPVKCVPKTARAPQGPISLPGRRGKVQRMLTEAEVEAMIDAQFEELTTWERRPEPATPYVWQPLDHDRQRTIGWKGKHAGTVMECSSPTQRLSLAIFEYTSTLIAHGYTAPKFPLGTSPVKSRFAPRILAALEEMRIEGVPPGIWIDWLVAWNRSVNADKPIPIQIALTVGLFRKRLQWFLKERQADFQRDRIYHPADVAVVAEQLFRNQEAARQHDNNGRVSSTWHFHVKHENEYFAAYARKRVDEIAKGITNPLTNYPRLPELPKRPVVRR